MIDKIENTQTGESRTSGTPIRDCCWKKPVTNINEKRLGFDDVKKRIR
jgi:hypothetical protein